MGTLNVAELRQKLQELKTGKKTQNTEYLKKFFNVPEFDENNVKRSTARILPGGINEEDNERLPFFTETLLHKINMKNVHCPRKIGKPCPICEYVRALWATNDPEKIAVARELKAKKRFYLNVIARERSILNLETGKEETKINDGPLIYSCGVKVMEKILRDIVDDEIGDITDLKHGYDFRIIKEVNISGYPGYDSSKSSKKSTPAGTEEEITRWMGELNDLNSLIKYSTHEELVLELSTFKGGGAPAETVETQPAMTTAKESKPVVSSIANEDEEDFLAQLDKIRSKDK